MRDGKRAERLREQLRRKRSIKRNVREERRIAQPAVPTPLESLPIETLDRGAHIVYGVDEDDVRTVLERLPPGTIDGLAGIRLSLARDDEGDADHAVPDPFTGRLGFEYLPGAWAIPVAGFYRIDGASITLVGHVVDPEHPLRDLLIALQRIDALSVLVHEVAHHVDHMTRVARGRWRADEEDKVEEYADKRTAEWTRSIALPYLEERHPAETGRLLDWIERHGGVRLSLATLADDADDPMSRFFPCSGAVQHLMGCVLEHTDPVDTRAAFAEELWLCDLHDALAVVLDGVLADAPDHRDALLTKCRLLFVRGDADGAEAIARGLSDADPEDPAAWDRLAEIQEDRFDWQGALASASRLFELTGDHFAAALRARALYGLGRYDEMEPDLARLPERIGDPLRACYLLATDQPREALAVAERALHTSPGHAILHPELVTVRYLAATRLGRPAEPPDDETRDRLRRRGFTALVSAF